MLALSAGFSSSKLRHVSASTAHRHAHLASRRRTNRCWHVPPRGAAAQAAALDGRARAGARPARGAGGAGAGQQGGRPPPARPCDLADCRADGGGDAAPERARDAGRRGGRPRRALARASPGGAHVRPARLKVAVPAATEPATCGSRRPPACARPTLARAPGRAGAASASS
eukprot:scaffold94238_cov63-Phaeocystis_antarctica.AAC.3